MTVEYTDIISCELAAVTASDLAVVNAARISLDTEHSELTESDAGLIRYLLSNRHGSPFEHGYFKFRVELPIFAIREHHRHRIGHSYNEMSGRYTELAPRFYLPARAREQQGKPGAYVFVERAEDDELTEDMQNLVQEAYAYSWDTYQALLQKGIAKEQARIVLPVGIFTKEIWSCNPRSLMHMLSLRNAPQAQAEIRAVAQQAEFMLQEHMPLTWAAFVENGRVAP